VVELVYCNRLCIDLNRMYNNLIINNNIQAINKSSVILFLRQKRIKKDIGGIQTPEYFKVDFI